ncbi:MAG: isocitrate/isopropylmalate dehydrogenase family protein [Chloroflexota bacterium]
MTYRITLMPGDGVGPEVTGAAVRVLEATGVKFAWDIFDVGVTAMDKFNTPLPEAVLESIRKNKVGLKGPVTTPVGTGFRSVNVAIRKALNLYACLRPCKSYPGIPAMYPNIDLVVVRENMEDLYAGIEFEKGKPETAKLIKHIADANAGIIPPDSGISIKMISETGSRRIVKFAFDYARTNQRKKVTAVHKANIMKFTDGLFLSVAHEVAKEYPDIEFEDRIADNMGMQLFQRPQQFDVIVAPNLFGDLFSDICAALVGGLGVAPGANLGADYAVFEAVHGSAPKYTGMNKVNPMAMIFTGIMMLRYLGEREAGDKVEKALTSVLTEGKDVTYDLKPQAPETAVGTAQVADAVIKKMNLG